MAESDEQGRQRAQRLEEEVSRLRDQAAMLRRQRDEARAWARAEYHQMWDAPYLPDNAPDWLTAPM